jgi:hypothetical protein
MSGGQDSQIGNASKAQSSTSLNHVRNGHLSIDILENSANPPQIDRNVRPSRSDETMKKEKSVQLQMSTKRIDLSGIPQTVQQ